jgi:hypothetical protein
MNVFLTGATGFVGKHLLYYILKSTDYSVTIPIREKKNKTSNERFAKEFTDSPLFKGADLSRVKIINKDIATIDQQDISGASCFIHCAASVKFNVSLDELLQDNYEPVKRLYDLCRNIKFIYISTCYTHPKTLKGPGKAVQIDKNVPREDFICDYAYTKYLTEQYLYEQDSQIDIIRLSCVGAPLEDLPPMRGPAHLGILELGYRKSIPDLWLPNGFQFSVVPLDIVCKYMLKVIQDSHSGLSIKQLSAPAENAAYNISGVELVKPIFKKNNIVYWNNISYDIFIFIMSFIYFMVPDLLKKLLDTNYIIHTVSSNISFEPSIDLPEISKEDYLNRTNEYVNRLVEENPYERDSWTEFLYSLFLSLKVFLVKLFFSYRSHQK